MFAMRFQSNNAIIIMPNYNKTIEKYNNSLQFFVRLENVSKALPSGWRKLVLEKLPKEESSLNKINTVWQGQSQNEVILTAMEQVSKEYVEEIKRLSA